MSIPTKPELVDSWAAFVQLAAAPFDGKWLFRGVLDDWDLKPSLQRACEDWNVPMSERLVVEKRLLRDFKRAYPPRAETPAPSYKEDLSWLALMQHHGAPTRLLDWTFSPFVAAFFALDQLLNSKASMAAVWALSGGPISNATVEAFLPDELKVPFHNYSRTRSGRAFRDLFLEAKAPFAFVTPVNPYALNERLIVQQGTFLCPGDVSRTFEENLLVMPGVSNPNKLRKILLPRSVLRDAFVGLYKMNITHATLFPGLDGYARSLRHRIGFLQDASQFFDATRY